jgi:hypothetical protein
MTLQELIQEARQLSWQDQLHLATRLLQWAETKITAQALTPQVLDHRPIPRLSLATQTELSSYSTGGDFNQAQAAVAEAQHRYGLHRFSDSTALIREDRDR